jgi:predicted alpha/beta-hydrolase family hydrolase
MNAPLLMDVEGALAARGHATLRWNFPYKERGKKAPDKMPALIEAYRAAVAAAREQLKGRAPRVVIGGKSMGGRIASMAAAQGLECDGLLFLGYPLHAAKKPETMRDAHLKGIAAPMLFVQGTRDPLCDLALLRLALKRIGRRASLHVVDGGDHSLDLLKSAERSRESVVEEIGSAIDAWLRKL